MSELKTRSTLQRRMTNFVDWIRPEKNTRDDIRERRNNVTKNISNQAAVDGLIVMQTPSSGSFANHTGLRRHYRGDAEVEGQDVDIPFVLKKETVEGETLDELLDRFERYAEASYPNSKIIPTKSSVKLEYSQNVSFDLVPMIAVERDDKQEIIRSNGDHIETSVRLHVDFIKSRTKDSKDQEGRVKFNECVRLLKWWRNHQASNARLLGGDDAPSSFLINLLAAKAYDEESVCETYAETLAQWSGYLAHLVNKKKPILFTDYNQPTTDTDAEWTVMDPVNATNNVVKKWGAWEIVELADWFSSARDEWSRIIQYNESGKDSDALKGLVKLFGNSFQNHCDQ